MKTIKLLVLTSTLLLTFTSCFEDMDDNPASSIELNDFVWRGLNAYYLYKDEVPDLANNRFNSDVEYNLYLNGFYSPENLFESLIYQPQSIDRFSWITSNYNTLEQQLNGTTLNNGMEFGLFRFNDTDTNVYGYVRYVLPGTSAEANGIQRGDIFNAINGSQLTVNNWSLLLSANSYSINLATYNDNNTPETNDDTVLPTNQSIALTKAPYTENPIFKTDIFEVAGKNVGYLMYNGFTAPYDTQLNSVFGNFLANNVQELVLDFRYNPGGSVNSAILLSSMIANNTGEIFSTEEWNSDIQALLEPESLINRFTNNDDGIPLNILNLNRVYVLTTRGSASASELVINCLRPYLDVVQIGTTTTGKFQASITLYDAPDFRKQNAKQTHSYAMQPLVLKSLNSLGVTDYSQGLTPDILQAENYNNLGVLGDINEPLLATALQHIEDSSRSTNNASNIEPLNFVGDSNDLTPFSKDMHINK
ncbi:S41 family peptidase [Corallibacter sp.]|uniref:S41 family peptidase n=1 Tax=Corallibacter sp. TaxID=2038084 RepID=UPI003AB6942E